LFSIDVGTLIIASPRLHAQVASYKMVSCLSDEKIPPSQKCHLSDLVPALPDVLKKVFSY
jgi:hypothetical protein